MTDIAVVGGGPAGSACAALLARGHDVTVFEEHPRIGVPVQCAGLISDAAIRLSGVSPSFLATVYGAEAVFPDGTVVEVRSKKPKARVVDRSELDSLMAARAMDAGAEYRMSERVRSVGVSDGVVLEHPSGTTRADLAIGADGPASVVAASIGNNAPSEMIRGIQADVRVEIDRQDMFRMHLGSEFAPGFFAWEIPCGDFTRVGLCTSWSAGPPAPYLKHLLSRLGYSDKVVGMSCGRIPVGRRRTMSSDRIMLVGDAASQIKPISGGGIYPSMMAAPLLAEVASSAIAENDLSAKRLGEYDRRFEAVVGRELRSGARIRRWFVRMDDDDLNRAGGYSARQDVRTVLDTMEIDNPVTVIPKLLRHPSVGIRGMYTLLRCLI